MKAHADFHISENNAGFGFSRFSVMFCEVNMDLAVTGEKEEGQGGIKDTRLTWTGCRHMHASDTSNRSCLRWGLLDGGWSQVLLTRLL